MEPKILTKSEFKVVGLKYHGANQNNEISDLWGAFLQRTGEIKDILNPKVTLGLCEHVPGFSQDSEFSYLICVEVGSLDEIPEGMVGKVVPSKQYAVFTHKGSADKLGETYEYIYGNWFLKAKYERTEADDFELYDERFTNEDNSEMEIYIPIQEANSGVS